MPEAVYLQINEEMISEAALRTTGAGGRSGVDANSFLSFPPCIISFSFSCTGFYSYA